MIKRLEKWADKIAENERVEKLKKRVEYLENIAQANGIRV